MVHLDDAPAADAAVVCARRLEVPALVTFAPIAVGARRLRICGNGAWVAKHRSSVRDHAENRKEVEEAAMQPAADSPAKPRVHDLGHDLVVAEENNAVNHRRANQAARIVIQPILVLVSCTTASPLPHFAFRTT